MEKITSKVRQEDFVKLLPNGVDPLGGNLLGQLGLQLLGDQEPLPPFHGLGQVCAAPLQALPSDQHHGHVGTIIRTAEALGLNGVIATAGTCDFYNPKVLRGRMGSVGTARSPHCR